MEKSLDRKLAAIHADGHDLISAALLALSEGRALVLTSSYRALEV